MKQNPNRGCTLNRRQTAGIRRICEGLSATIDFADALLQELADYDGDVGLPRALRALWDDYSACFSQDVLVAEINPTSNAVHAFERLYTELRPELEHTLWPPAHWGIGRQMPPMPPVDEYLRLALHCRQAWSRSRKIFDAASQALVLLSWFIEPYMR
jgi:hypothetical protein